MGILRGSIGSLGNLVIFEAAARHGNFTRAAEELRMTQAAVSYAIRNLEQNLSVALFVRGHRAVRLTEPGRQFLKDVSIGLRHIEHSVAALQRSRADRHVTLSASTSFATYWMLPRLAEFNAANPGVQLRLLATDRDSEIPPEGNLLSVRRGGRRWTQSAAALFADEYIYPVCTPSYLQAVLGARSSARSRKAPGVGDLAGLDLIHLDEPYRLRPSWADWFQAQGHGFIDSGEGLRLNDYALVVEAALGGQGVALGWGHLTDRLVARGTLRRVSSHVWWTEHRFWVAWAGDLTPETEHARDWLIAHRPEPIVVRRGEARHPASRVVPA